MATRYIEFNREEWGHLSDVEFEFKKEQLFDTWKRDSFREEKWHIAHGFIMGLVFGGSMSVAVMSVHNSNKSSNPGKNKDNEFVEPFPKGAANIFDTFGCDFYSPGAFGNTVVPDKTFFLKAENFFINPFGDTRKLPLPPVEIKVQKDAERAGNPVNKDFFHKATL